MSVLDPLETLYDPVHGIELPLPPELTDLYGHLMFNPQPGRPYIISNFVTTLDGVVTLGDPGHAGAGDISGFNPHDRMVMGLLRAIADVVIIGEGGLRTEPDHLWTAPHIFPALTDAYRKLRDNLGKTEQPLTVVVTACGGINTGARIFRSGEVPVLVATTAEGCQQLRGRELPPSVPVMVMKERGLLSAEEIIEAACRARGCETVLVEGGPHLVSSFFAGKRLDELFLTLAPQIAGRDGSAERLGLIAGMTFAPANPLWGRLVSVKRGGSHLFLRYAFASDIDWKR
ncbi:MAG: Bifunctional deaminase-reductase domain [Geobacteraceae bacterium]|nr:MAG: Bifunctional deaminase-reductase domain [Geobacteraceae bacterium]